MKLLAVQEENTQISIYIFRIFINFCQYSIFKLSGCICIKTPIDNIVNQTCHQVQSLKILSLKIFSLGIMFCKDNMIFVYFNCKLF